MNTRALTFLSTLTAAALMTSCATRVHVAKAQLSERRGGRQPFQMAGAGGGDAMHRLALAEEGLAQNRQRRRTAISHPGSN